MLLEIYLLTAFGAFMPVAGCIPGPGISVLMAGISLGTTHIAFRITIIFICMILQLIGKLIDAVTADRTGLSGISAFLAGWFADHFFFPAVVCRFCFGTTGTASGVGLVIFCPLAKGMTSGRNSFLLCFSTGTGVGLFAGLRAARFLGY